MLPGSHRISSQTPPMMLFSPCCPSPRSPPSTSPLPLARSPSAVSAPQAIRITCRLAESLISLGPPRGMGLPPHTPLAHHCLPCASLKTPHPLQILNKCLFQMNEQIYTLTSSFLPTPILEWLAFSPTCGLKSILSTRHPQTTPPTHLHRLQLTLTQ